MKEGLEAMALLEEAVDKARKAGRSVPAAKRALALAGELVTIPNARGLRSTEILPDPERLPAARRAGNAALVQLLPENASSPCMAHLPCYRNAKVSDGWPCCDSRIARAMPGQPVAQPKSLIARSA
jgi:hypothetical protein